MTADLSESHTGCWTHTPRRRRRRRARSILACIIREGSRMGRSLPGSAGLRDRDGRSVPVPVRRPNPRAMAAVARQRYHVAERLRELEAETRAARGTRARAADAGRRSRRRRAARPCRGQKRLDSIGCCRGCSDEAVEVARRQERPASDKSDSVNQEPPRTTLPSPTNRFPLRRLREAQPPAAAISGICSGQYGARVRWMVGTVIATTAATWSTPRSAPTTRRAYASVALPPRRVARRAPVR